MSPKTMVMISMTIGSLIGGYIPSFFGLDIFSVWGILATAIGGFIGIYIGWKLSEGM